MFKAEKEESTGLIIKEADGEGSSEGFRRKSLLLGVLTPTAGGSFLPAAGGAVLGCHAAMSELGARERSCQPHLRERRAEAVSSAWPRPCRAAAAADKVAGPPNPTALATRLSRSLTPCALTAHPSCPGCHSGPHRTSLAQTLVPSQHVAVLSPFAAFLCF